MPIQVLLLPRSKTASSAKASTNIFRAFCSGNASAIVSIQVCVDIWEIARGLHPDHANGLPRGEVSCGWGRETDFRASGAIKRIWILDIASYHHDNLPVMIIGILVIHLVSIVNALIKSDFLEQNRNPVDLDLAPS